MSELAKAVSFIIAATLFAGVIGYGLLSCLEVLP